MVCTASKSGVARALQVLKSGFLLQQQQPPSHPSSPGRLSAGIGMLCVRFVAAGVVVLQAVCFMDGCVC